MPFVPTDGKANKCTGCQKTVYPNEAIRAANGTYHKGCLKCQVCNITLNLKTCMSHESKPYCNTHIPKVGHTQVASVTTQSALSAPKAAGKVQGVAKDARMTFAPGAARGVQPRGRGGAPRAAARGAPRGGAGSLNLKVGGGGNKCPGCQKTVYTNEELVACNGRWHKGCLKCMECKITLNIKTVQPYMNKPYCKTHVPKVGHTQVASVEMQNAMKAPKAARAVKGVNKTARATFAPGALNAVDGSNVVNRGGVAGSDVQAANAPKQTFVAPEPAASITYDAPAEQFSNMSVADNQSFDTGASYDQGGYADEGYAEETYDQGGYAEEAYDQGGYADEGYAEQGYAEEAYADEGYAEEAYAEEGYAEEGYYEEGYDEGYYEEGYAEEGYYEEGYDEGYYEEGYDEGY